MPEAIKPTIERIERPIVKAPPRKSQSTTVQKKPNLDAQRAKLKSSMSTRQLINENSPNYNVNFILFFKEFQPVLFQLWLQRNLADQKRRQAEEKAKKDEEERV